MRRLPLLLLLAACAVPARGPATLDDIASTVQGREVVVPVLANDWPQSGLTLVGVDVPPGQGAARIEDGRIRYDPGDFTGTAELVYRVEAEGLGGTGRLSVQVDAAAPLRIDAPSFGEVPLFTMATLPVTVDGLNGPPNVESQDPELSVDVGGCAGDGWRGPCELLASWTPDSRLGPHRLSFTLAGVPVELSGSAVHAVRAPEAVLAEAEETAPFESTFPIENRTDRPLTVDTGTADPRLTVGTCTVLPPGGGCDVVVTGTAGRPDDPIAADVAVRYGVDEPVHTLRVPVQVAVLAVPLAAPELESPLVDPLWIGELVEPITFRWQGEPGPDGWLLEIAHCTAPDRCAPVDSVATDIPEHTVALDEVLEAAILRSRAGERPGAIEWRVSALAGERRGPAASATLVLTEEALTLRPPRFDPPSGTAREPTEIATYAGELVVFEIPYRSNLLADAGYRLEIEARLGARIDDPFTATGEGLDPATGSVAGGGEGTIGGFLSLTWGDVAALRVFVVAGPCPRGGCLVGEYPAHFRFYGSAGPD